MQRFYILLLFFSFGLHAQDKLFLKNGTMKKVVIVSVSTDIIFYKNSDTSLQTLQIPKTELLLAENYKGDVFIFSETAKNIKTETANIPVYKRNAIQLQPFGLLLGRATVVYERFTKNNKIGFVFPLSLTFDPIGKIYKGIDTSKNSIRRTPGINFMGGLDVDFYVGRNKYAQFFLGPRIRYGTDMFLGGTEAYSVQTQFGWLFGNPEKKLVQHLSFGFGFVRILASPTGTRISSKQSYVWMSINYRLGIKW